MLADLQEQIILVISLFRKFRRKPKEIIKLKLFILQHFNQIITVKHLIYLIEKKSLQLFLYLHPSYQETGIWFSRILVRNCLCSLNSGQTKYQENFTLYLVKATAEKQLTSYSKTWLPFKKKQKYLSYSPGPAQIPAK